MKTISIKKALEFISEREGKIFSIKFVKRTTGELRVMSCRQGVKAGLVENPMSPGLDFKAHALVPVYDMAKKAYRSIPIEGITEIMMYGEWFKVEKEK